MCRYCEVHRGPERVKVLEVNVSLVDIKVGTGADLVLVAKDTFTSSTFTLSGPLCTLQYLHMSANRES